MSKERIEIVLEYDRNSHDSCKLKRFLKWALRSWGLKCVALTDSKPPVSGVIENEAKEAASHD